MVDGDGTDPVDGTSFGAPDVTVVTSAAAHGALPRWPLVHCTGDPAAAAELLGSDAVVDVWPVGGADDLDVLDAEWTDRHRPGLFDRRSAEPGTSAWIVTVDGLQAAFALVQRPAEPASPWRLVTIVTADADDAATVFGAVCAQVARDGARELGAHVPGPHPALPVLLRAGWRVDDVTLRYAGADDPMDPTRVVPDPLSD